MVLFELKPDIIIELGNCFGGSTLAMAHLLDNIGKGKIIGVDINHKKVPSIVKNHNRISFLTSDAIVAYEKIKNMINLKDVVLIIEDSSHEYDNTLNILRTYHDLVSIGSYFIIEDSICHHGLDLGPNPGPYEAIEKFLSENDKFEIDKSRESFIITWNPNGYLKKIK